MDDIMNKLCSVELDRLTAAEICIDECLTILDRHGARGSTYRLLQKLSEELSEQLFEREHTSARRNRLIRIRAGLTSAFPMTDEDLAAGPAPTH